MFGPENFFVGHTLCLKLLLVYNGSRGLSIGDILRGWPMVHYGPFRFRKLDIAENS